MRVKTLIEADYNFGSHTADVLDKVTRLAGGAYNKLKSGYQQSQAEIRAAQEKAAKEAEKKGKAPVADLATTAANLITSKYATREDVEALNLDASQLQDLSIIVQEFDNHIAKLPVALKKALLASGMLGDDQKHDLDDRLANRDNAKLIQSAQSKIDKDNNGEQDLWHQALVNKDLAEVSQNFIKSMQRLSTANEKYNAGIHTQVFQKGPKPKMRPVGTGLIDIIAVERQAIAERIADMKSIIADIEQHPNAAPVSESITRLAKKARTKV